NSIPNGGRLGCPKGFGSVRGFRSAGRLCDHPSDPIPISFEGSSPPADSPTGIYSVANKRRICYPSQMDEGRKRVIGIMAAILASLHMRTADDLFGGPQGSPRTDKLIAASVQWAGLHRRGERGEPCGL